MAKRSRRKKLPKDPVRVKIEGFSHDCRGIARVDDKTVFVEGALDGEEVSFIYAEKKRDYDVGVVSEVHRASPQRVEPKCAHFGICGGCSLQHMSAEAQIEAKQQVLLDNFQRLGKVSPAEVLSPLTGPPWGYRRKARLGVRFVIKKDRVLVGFRERRAPYLADLTRCEVLHPSVGEHLGTLEKMIAQLDAYDRIAQIEVAVDDTQTALVLRNLDVLSDADKQKLCDFAEAENFKIYLQPKGPDTVAPLWPENIKLGYSLPAYGVDFSFEPTDFTQVNTDINQKMIDKALELLALEPDDRVLDLFCGLGNFTLPIASEVEAAVGIEGDAGLVARARENAQNNGLDNVEFHVADLSEDLSSASWWKGGFTKVLLDPARIGAQETLSHIARLGIKRIVYVSCNPATLARDAGILVNEFGYTLETAGVMDMFPHTAHVESIALFTK
ncbi:MAG: 23S rRNA (uracil(1939)-C(5))-methyltransferase RlmD [Gammaproteobacteria bacterium]|nr:23S rRNA (uracil(1939)-C(5))-methyltransferase RlmD [Gammaproteobacteria bacterium]